MKLLYKAILATFLIPFAQSMAMEGLDDKDAAPKAEAKKLRINITPDMGFDASVIEYVKADLEKEAEALSIYLSPELKSNFNALSNAVTTARLERAAKTPTNTPVIK